MIWTFYSASRGGELVLHERALGALVPRHLRELLRPRAPVQLDQERPVGILDRA